MKPVVSIVALAIAMTPALALAGPKDKAHHGKHAVHAGQTHHATRTHVQVVTPASHRAQADAKPAHKDVVPASHKTSATKQHDAKKAEAPKAEPKKEDAKPDVVPAVAMTAVRASNAPAHDAKAPAQDVEKKNLPSPPEPDTAAVTPVEPAATQPTPKESTPTTSSKGHGHGHSAKTAPEQAKAPCFHEPVLFVRGAEEESFSLTKCDGTLAPHAIDQLSILARPGNVQRPTMTLDAMAKVKGPDLAPGIRRVDPILVDRLQKMISHFAKQGAPSKVFLVSGYRPASVGSFHQGGKAIDFRIDGITNESLVEECKRLEDTGCGYYPNSSFIHMDVRDAGTGHVSWIDASGPGEPPRYVRSWPEHPADGLAQATPAWIADVMSKLDSAHTPDKPAEEAAWAARISN
jgi:hypothetical protein